MPRNYCSRKNKDKSYHCPTGIGTAVIDARVNSNAVCRIESLTAMTPADEEKIVTCDHCGTIYDANLSPNNCPAVREICIDEVGKVDTNQRKIDAREAGEPEPVFVQRTIEHTSENGKAVKVDVVCLVIHESMYDNHDALDCVDDDTTLEEDEAEFVQYLAAV